MRLDASDIRELNLMKHYRIIRKWACKNNNLNDADLELLIYLDCIDFFTKKDFEMGVYSYSWDNRRWNRLLKEGWIVDGDIETDPLKNTIYIKYLSKVSN